MADGWLRRKQRAAKKVARQSADAMPDGLWTKCSKCGEILFSKDLEKGLRVCKKCGYHYKLTARERIEVTADEGTFEEFAVGLVSANPLGFPEYDAKIEKGKTKSPGARVDFSSIWALYRRVASSAWRTRSRST